MTLSTLEKYLIKCDAYLGEDGWVGMGVIARNQTADVIFAGSRKVPGRWPVESSVCTYEHFVPKLIYALIFTLKKN